MCLNWLSGALVGVGGSHVIDHVSYVIETLGRGDDTVGNPHRAQISQFELFELILLLKLDN